MLSGCSDADVASPLAGTAGAAAGTASQSTAGQSAGGAPNANAGSSSTTAGTFAVAGQAGSVAEAGGTANNSGGSAPGSGGAGTAGSNTGGAPPGVECPAGSFLCEGFEAYPTNAPPTGIWTATERGTGSIKVDDTRNASGSKALHVTGTIKADIAHITTPVTFDANTMFIRFKMFTIGYPSTSGVHSRLARIGTKKDTGPDSSYSLASYNGTAIEKVDSIYQRSVDTKLNDDAYKNRWLCIEFEIDKTGGIGKVQPHIWFDGKALALAPAGSTTHAGTSASWDPIPYELFTIGVEGNQDDPVSGNFWIDDLVIAPARIGCPAQ